MLEDENDAVLLNYQLNITSGTGNDNITVTTTGEGTELFIDAGLHNDVIKILGLRGNAMVHGGNSGNNYFFVDARLPGDEKMNTM